MVCDICGQEGVRVRSISEAHGKGKDLLVIENIPMNSCPHCGESYFTAETLHEVERIRMHRSNIARPRPVEVVNYV